MAQIRKNGISCLTYNQLEYCNLPQKVSVHFIGMRETFHATELSALFALFSRNSSIVSI